MKMSEFIELYGDVEINQEQVDSMKPKPKKWKPNYGEKYFYFGSYGKIYVDICTDRYADFFRINFMRVFKTEKEAERYLEIMEYCKEQSFEPNWDDEKQNKYSIMINHNKVGISSLSCSNYACPFYFESKEKAQSVIDRYGDGLKKYLFGVE